MDRRSVCKVLSTMVERYLEDRGRDVHANPETYALDEYPNSIDVHQVATSAVLNDLIDHPENFVDELLTTLGVPYTESELAEIAADQDDYPPR